jgi:hypothetical protein
MIRLWRFTDRIGLHELVVVVAAFLVYFLIRGSVVGRAGEAMVRAIELIALERRLGIYWELEMQSWIIDHYWMIKAMNWIYFWGHMPLVIVFAVWLYFWHRRFYRLVRNSFLASGAIGVVIYALYPVAPPRLVPFAGYVDTMAVFDRVGYNAQEVSMFVNPFAAVPSLHFGWSMLLGLVIAYVGRSALFWAIGIAWPVAMFFAIIMTGNHFILDAVAGAIVSFVGLAIALGLERVRPRIHDWLADRLPALRHEQQGPAVDEAKR